MVNPKTTNTAMIELRPPMEVTPVNPLDVAPDPGIMSQMYIGARLKYEDGMTLACATPREGWSYDQIKEEYARRYAERNFMPDPNFDVSFFDEFFIVEEPDHESFMAQLDPTLSDLDNLDKYTLDIRPKFIFPNTKQGHFDVWLPHPRAVAGAGRFGKHSFLWDGYQMAKGYAADGEWELVLDVVDNTEYQIMKYGYPLNGSADFYVTRAQPDYFSHEVRMLADHFGPEVLVRYLAAMEKNHMGYWMDGMRELSELPDDGRAHAHRTLVRMPDGSFLNRYWDDGKGARLESLKEDHELAEKVIAMEGLTGALARMRGRQELTDLLKAHGLGEIDHANLDEDAVAIHGLGYEIAKIRKQLLFKDLRAGAASGWDYSSRWFEDGSTLETINTTDIAPIDLNSLMVYNEETLAMAYEAAADMGGYNGLSVLECREKSAMYQQMADNRKEAIRKYMWDDQDEIFRDHNFVKAEQTRIVSAAMAYPLYVGMASLKETVGVVNAVERDLLYEGGIIATTTENSTQQWEGGERPDPDEDPEITAKRRSKNVWAPPNWAYVRGVARMAHKLMSESVDFDPEMYEWLLQRAETAQKAYMHGVQIAFNTHRIVPEKHRGDNPHVLANGGEYALVKVLAMPSETWRAMKKLNVRDAKDHLPRHKQPAGLMPSLN